VLEPFQKINLRLQLLPFLFSEILDFDMLDRDELPCLEIEALVNFAISSPPDLLSYLLKTTHRVLKGRSIIRT
jgi:hypothetical protein